MLAACSGDKEAEAERDALREQAREMCADLEAAVDGGVELGVPFNEYVREQLDDSDDTVRVASYAREECGDLVTAHWELRRELADEIAEAERAEAQDGEGDNEASTNDNPSGTGEALTDDQLAELHRRCAGRDMWACDELYMESPWGSDYEAFGESCGGLREDHAEGVFCEDVFGDGEVEPPDPFTDEEKLLILQVSWDQLSSLERQVMCDEVANGDSAAISAGGAIAEASGGLVTSVEATAFLRMAC